MPMIRPFAGLRPVAEHAANVVAPPYDVLNSAEARQQAENRPWSFLHISKPEIDLEPGIDVYDPQVYQKGAENLRKMRDENILFQDEQPCYYLYRLVMGEHSQTGLVAVASVEEYDRNRIRKHEFTRPDKEDDRVRQIDALNAQTGPVFLTYRHDPTVDALVQRVTAGEPEYDLTAADGVRHTLWRVAAVEDVETLSSAFNAMEYLYIADGHHRSAAASRVAAMRQKDNPGHTGDESYNFFQVVLFPDNQMEILDYNRVVKDLNDLSVASFLEAIKDRFSVESSPAPVRPEQPGQFGLYLEGAWYRLQIKENWIPQDDPVARLDVSLLHDNLIEPLLGISDPRRDKRIDFVGGIRGLAELEKRVDSGEMKAAFSFYPTRLADLMAVADAEKVMPPKSTWFEPKLADGLVSHVLD